MLKDLINKLRIEVDELCALASDFEKGSCSITDIHNSTDKLISLIGDIQTDVARAYVTKNN